MTRLLITTILLQARSSGYSLYPTGAPKTIPTPRGDVENPSRLPQTEPGALHTTPRLTQVQAPHLPPRKRPFGKTWQGSLCSSLQPFSGGGGGLDPQRSRRIGSFRTRNVLPQPRYVPTLPCVSLLHPTARDPTSRKLVLTSRVTVPRQAREAAVTALESVCGPAAGTVVRLC